MLGQCSREIWYSVCFLIQYIPAIILVKEDNVHADLESPKTNSWNRDVLCREKLITEVIVRHILGTRHHIFKLN